MGDARFAQYDLHPMAAPRAEVVAETYATPNCVTDVGEFALRLV